MALVVCKECKKQVSDTAEKCPHCGAKIPKKLSFIHWLGIGFAGHIVYAMFAGGNKATNTTPAPATASPPRPALPVSSIELARAYEQNEAAADGAYKGRLLKVTGVVTDITKDFMDDTVVILRGVSEFLGVHAELHKSEEQKATTLRKGQTVTVQCRGAGEVVSSPNA
jgi:hypothetical protein